MEIPNNMLREEFAAKLRRQEYEQKQPLMMIVTLWDIFLKARVNVQPGTVWNSFKRSWFEVQQLFWSTSYNKFKAFQILEISVKSIHVSREYQEKIYTLPDEIGPVYLLKMFDL